jgi:ABC-type bacteriocin/lantibiotic exporter with double-glycine peptidase domain
VTLGIQGESVRGYDTALGAAVVTGSKRQMLTGLCEGVVMAMIFGSYGLAFWYGSTLVGKGSMTTGNVVTVFFSILSGSG